MAVFAGTVTKGFVLGCSALVAVWVRFQGVNWCWRGRGRRRWCWCSREGKIAVRRQSVYCVTRSSAGTMLHPIKATRAPVGNCEDHL